MLQINFKIVNGEQIAEFTSRKVDYTVFEKNNGEYYEVWGKRQSLSKFSMPTITQHNNLEEMGARTKALKHLAILWAAEKNEAGLN